MGDRSRRLVIILIVMSLMMLWADQNLIPPMLVKLEKEGMIPGVENSATGEYLIYEGLLGTVPIIAGIATTFVWGYLADKISRRKLFALAVLVGEVPCFLTGFARNYWEMLLLRTFTGIGINGAAPVARALVADIYPPEERGKGYAIYNFSTGFGVLLGMLMAGIVVSIGLSWRIPFMVAALPNFILVPIFLTVVKEIKIGAAEPEISKLYESGAEYKFRIHLREFFKALAATPTLIFLYLQGIPGTFPWGAIPYWSPKYFQTKWGVSEAVATLIVFAAGIGMMMGYFIAGILSDKLLRKGMINARLLIPFSGILIGTITAIALLSYPYPYGADDFAALLPVILLGVLGMVFVTFSAPNVPAVLSEVSLPEHRGTIFGLFNITDNIGSALGPITGSIFIAYFSKSGLSEPDAMHAGLVAISLLWVPCALLWLPALRTYRRDREKIRKILAERASTTRSTGAG